MGKMTHLGHQCWSTWQHFFWLTVITNKVNLSTAYQSWLGLIEKKKKKKTSTFQLFSEVFQELCWYIWRRWEKGDKSMWSLLMYTSAGTCYQSTNQPINQSYKIFFKIKSVKLRRKNWEMFPVCSHMIKEWNGMEWFLRNKDVNLGWF
jgi:hypothetical protein